MIVFETSGVPVKAWVDGVSFEDAAKEQVLRIATMPFAHKHVAVMPDVHLGIGATVGSVVATKGAIIPAAVGVDIGCGMMAVKTTLTASDLPDSLKDMRSSIEAAVPHGRTDNGGANDRGAWGEPPGDIANAWKALGEGIFAWSEKHPKIRLGKGPLHVGTLGTGNHFIEVCLDESDNVWIMLHSGSRGVGNQIGQYFIELAKKDMMKFFINLPDKDLAYFPQDTEHFDDYVGAVSWAQSYALMNREVMMAAVVKTIGAYVRPFELTEAAVNCHHNYVAWESHFGSNVLVTRKGAVRARLGDLGIIPGSMGARSYIVRGKGNPDSFHSCSHGAGRRMSRTQARKSFSVDDHAIATAGVECRKDADVVDETPGAYKDIDAVMAAQADLVDVVHTLKQVLCVKG